MYLSHFKLDEFPFKITSDLDFYHHQESRDFALQTLKMAIDRGEGIIKVVGEVGSGKTTLLRLLVISLPKYFKIIYMPAPNISSKDLLFFICSELNLQVDPNLNKQQLVKLMQSKLISFYAASLKIIILIDESQVIPIDTLEELRLLSNLETEKDKLLQLVFFGQTEFDVTLDSVEAKPLLARVATSIYLNEFTWVEVRQYLNFRMRVAGYQGEDFFSKKDAKKICKISLGLPRKINIVADKLLLSACSHNRMKLKRVDYRSLDEFYKTRITVFIPILIVFLVISLGAVLLYIDGKIFTPVNSLLNDVEIAQTGTSSKDDVVVNYLLDELYTVLVYSGSLIEFNAKLRVNSALKEFVSAEKTSLRLNKDKTGVVVFYGLTPYKNEAENMALQEHLITNWPSSKVVSMQMIDDIVN